PDQQHVTLSVARRHAPLHRTPSPSSPSAAVGDWRMADYSSRLSVTVRTRHSTARTSDTSAVDLVSLSTIQATASVDTGTGCDQAQPNNGGKKAAAHACGDSPLEANTWCGHRAHDPTRPDRPQPASRGHARLPSDRGALPAHGRGRARVQ